MGIEDIYRKKIEGFIRGVRMGTKQTDDNKIHSLLNGLEKINSGLADDYLKEYNNVVNQQRKLVS